MAEKVSKNYSICIMQYASILYNNNNNKNHTFVSKRTNEQAKNTMKLI